MKQFKLNEFLKTKKRGGASMFVVLFTIIILSVIVLSFTRLIVSEAAKTTNTDLSQSAYDSALAGVEDAKIALLRYHDCLDQGATATSGSTYCRAIIKKMQDGINNNDCSTVQKVLGREQASENNSVVVQETQRSNQEGNNTNMLQAYTCVTIKEDLDDYRTTLSSAGRLRIIPIRSDHIDQLDTVQVKWFSSTNASQLASHGGSVRYCGNNRSGNTLLLYPNGQCNGSYQGPPTLTVRLIQTDATFDLSELSVSKASNQTDTGELIFVPTNSGGTTSVGADAWGESANKGTNLPIQAQCSAGTWYCSMTMSLPKTFRGSTARNDANTYLLLSIPYGTPETDISVTTYGPADSGGSRQQYEFSGVQARIDSTGRANDLYRRVETRVELVDTYFAYPEYEITMTGANSNIYKSFYATFNCWRADAGAVDYCTDTAQDLTMHLD